MIIVEDSAAVDQEVFVEEGAEGTEWVRVSDEVPVDSDALDSAMQTFQTHYHPGAADSVSETALEQGDEEYDEGEDGQEPGRED